MNIEKSSNPALNNKIFEREQVYGQQTMTLNGTIAKTGLMLLLVIAGAVFTWTKFYNAFGFHDVEGAMSVVMPWILTGGIGAFVVAIVTAFRPKSAAFTAPVYAVLEGVFLGAISAMFEVSYGGIVMRAVLLTMAVFAMMLMLYRTGTIRVTSRFRKIIIAATGAIALVYIGSFIASLLGAQVGFLYGNSMLSIGISLVVVVVAALNLTLDFDFIDRASQSGAPKYMEWYGAFGLMVTLVWLYLELLRLLAKASSRN